MTLENERRNSLWVPEPATAEAIFLPFIGTRPWSSARLVHAVRTLPSQL